ncbi:MAG: tRNA (guanine37-N1)-methyltransferase [Thermoproteota archaeon]|nr:tRNA (guanine37-N1)-methyltransferase [Thermoproteota archaeon]
MRKRFVREFLRNKLTREELEEVNTSFDIVGDIVIIKVPETLEGKEGIIADAIRAANKNVKTILNQVSPISGEYRLRELEWVWGEKRTTTIHKEYGCSFKTDLSNTYFSPRLAHERMRISRIAQAGEVIVNMFAGVGCFSIILAKHSNVAKVYSIDINPLAVELMRQNALLNRVEVIVEVIQGDSKKVVEKNLKSVANRVLMPLPEKAYDYLDTAVIALKPGIGFIHYYDFIYAVKGEKSTEKVVTRFVEAMRRIKVDFEVIDSRIVRTVGPNWYQVVLDVKTSS